jgi:hypothetical protein
LQEISADAQEDETSSGLEIAYAVGSALCALAGMTFAAAITVLVFLFFDVVDLNKRLHAAETERQSQFGEGRSALVTLEARLEAVSGRLTHVERHSWSDPGRQDPRATLQNMQNDDGAKPTRPADEGARR